MCATFSLLKHNVMKKFFITVIALVLVITSFAFYNGGIDERLKQSFHTQFPNAQKVSWQESGDSYVVYFVDGNVQERIIYAKDNSYVQIFRYYKEENLPYQVQYILQKKYPDTKVFGVTEISTVSAAKTLTVDYNVTLDDAKKWYLVKIHNDGNLTLDKRYKKR